MEMYQNLGNFIDNHSSPFFVGSLVEKKVLFVNKIGKKMFDCTEETCDFEKIFERTEERMESLIAKGLQTGKTSIVYNFYAVTGAQEKIVVDLQFGFFNEEKTEMFLEIMLQNDTRLQMALHQIKNSPRAEAILNFDEKLSIVDCNEAFHKVFESSEELRHSHFKNDLVNGFLPEIRECLLADIHKTLERSDVFSTEIKVFTATGEEKWYGFDLQKRELDNSGTKLMCYMVNIEKEVKRKKENDLLNQYLSIMQKSSSDILYRVDVNENTMYHYSDFITVGGKGRAIVDYISVFMSGEVIHPDDRDAYLQGFKGFYDDDVALDTPIRFSFDGGEYRWYRIAAKKIFDSQGELVEVFGALLNVDSEVHLQEEVSTVHNYFEAFQSVSDESFFVINLEEKTLTQKGNVAKELGITDVLKNFPECAFDIIHPEDLSHFKAFTEESIEGDTIRVETRMKTVDGDYQWYELHSQGIKDKQGETTELVGKINNIQKQKKMQTEVTLLTQYFDTMQSLSDESIYVFDLETKLLHLGGLTETELGMPLILERYPESFFPYTHPDDLNSFKTFASRTLDTYESRLELRLKNVDGSYQLYELLSNVIYGENGAPSKILGKIRNIQSKYQLETAMQETNQFLEIMQTLSDDILYSIDIETKTLQFTLKTENGSIVTKTYENYPQSAIDHELTHPDDVNAINQQYEEFLAGTMKRIPVRLKLDSDEYLWYLDTALEISDTEGKNKKIYGSLKNIHKEVMAVKRQKEEYQHFTAMRDLSDDIFFRVDNKLTLHHNVESKHKIIQSKEISNYPTAFIDEKIIHPDDVEKYQQARMKFELGESFDATCRFAFFDETYLWYTIKARKIYDEDGQVVEVIGRLINVQKEHDMQSEYSVLNQYFSAMQDLSADVLFHIDIETMTFHHNDKKSINSDLTYDIPDFVNTFIEKNIIHPDCHESYRKDIDDMLSGRKMEYHVLSLSKPDVYEWFYVQGKFIRNVQGQVVEIFGKMKNVQEQRNLEQRAYHDMMTGALNKSTFEEQGQNILETAKPEEKCAVIFIDLDDFKGVNDTLGHSYGDALLTIVGKRLKRLVRGDDLVGRIGGDEFAVMLRNVDSEDSVLVRTNLMLEALQEDFSFEEKAISIKASVGVSVYPQHGKNYKDLIGKADMAVYQSKRRGKTVVSMYSEELDEY